MMDLDSFPDIENFQKLPREVIVKGAATDFDPEKGAAVQGIVINNVGHPVANVSLQLVVFDEDKLPIFSATTKPDPDKLQQGGLANFRFQLSDFKEEVKDYYLHANWRFDES